MKKLLLSLLFAGLTLSSAAGTAATAVLAGGCFWCMEADFEKLPGVRDVVSGFTGGTHPNPTYNGGHDGHYEAVEITYDPAVIDYQGLLDHFWVNIDPFDARGQFCDKGHSYLAAIFVANEQERELAQQSKQKVIEMFADRKVVMPILPRTSGLLQEKPDSLQLLSLRLRPRPAPRGNLGRQGDHQLTAAGVSPAGRHIMS